MNKNRPLQVTLIKHSSMLTGMLAVAFFIMYSLELGPWKNVQNNEEGRPPMTDILDRQGSALEQSFFFNDVSMHTYSARLNSLLHGGLEENEIISMLQYMETYPIEKLRFVPEYYLPVDIKTHEMIMVSQREGEEESYEFWHPWLIRYVGGEGPYWREQGKGNGNLFEKEEYFKKAADLGDAEGMYLYAQIRIRANDPQGLFWLLKSAESGFTDAMREVGLQYIRGEILSRDLYKARQYYEMATQDPIGVEYRTLAAYYREGEGGVKQDIIRAFIYDYVADVLAYNTARDALQASYMQHIIPGIDPEMEAQNYQWAGVLAEAQEEAQRILQEIRQQQANREQESVNRWQTILSEVKEDIRTRAPWMQWVFVPQDIRQPICEQTYQDRLAANNGQFPPPPLPDSTVPIPWPLPE